MNENKKQDDYYTKYNYKDRTPVYIPIEDLRDDQKDRLIKSDTFCMIPWIHMHGFPDGRAYPCCLAEMDYPIGDLRKNTMEEIWNDIPYKDIRANMLTEKKSKECSKCYEQENSGFISMRNSANKNFGQHIGLVDDTKPDGTYSDFKIRYYDIRFSNLCNFSCRSCGSLFSSSWYNEETKLFGKRGHPQIMYAGKDENDMWEQMQQHIPHLEQIYFAGGEPLIMEEHYKVLDELVRLEKFDVRLIYNTNFSKLRLRDKNVLDYWKLFKSVSVGASLDDMGARAEYVRKGTKWDEILRNREQMLLKSPNVDFYVSSTVSLLNVWHQPEFHKDWVERGFIKPQDWNVNILQGPDRMRIDVLPQRYKKEVEEKLLNHIYWLGPKDSLKRATNGYKSMITFMNGEDKSHLLNEFFVTNDKLDESRNEKFEEVFPEYKELRNYVITK
jgi:radical SAM protein with 4Fe4S-binding SPASM domain